MSKACNGSGYSTHADQQELIDFVSGIPSAPRELSKLPQFVRR
jgi:hypothetical protein